MSEGSSTMYWYHTMSSLSINSLLRIQCSCTVKPVLKDMSISQTKCPYITGVPSWQVPSESIHSKPFFRGHLSSGDTFLLHILPFNRSLWWGDTSNMGTLLMWRWGVPWSEVSLSVLFGSLTLGKYATFFRKCSLTNTGCPLIRVSLRQVLLYNIWCLTWNNPLSAPHPPPPPLYGHSPHGGI